MIEQIRTIITLEGEYFSEGTFLSTCATRTRKDRSAQRYVTKYRILFNVFYVLPFIVLVIAKKHFYCQTLQKYKFRSFSAHAFQR